MIIRTSGGGDHLMPSASGEWGTSWRIPSPGTGRISQAGTIITEELVFGIPAVSAVIRSAAETIASMPFITYRGTDVRERATDAWQYRLLHDIPNDDQDSFQFWYDVLLSIESTQNCFIHKVFGFTPGELEALYILDPQRVKVNADYEGVASYEYIGRDGSRISFDPAEILHVRSFTRNPGSPVGTSLIDIHMDPLGNAIAMQKFEGDYFRNHAVPPFYLTGAKNKQHAQDLLDMHNQKHAGAGNQWKMGAVWGDIDVKPIPISIKDAMFIEAKNMSIEDVCRIWRWPRALMEIGEVRESTIDWNVLDTHVLKMYILPRLRRIERAFAADPDLYLDTGLYGEFLTDSIERGDVHSRYDAYRLARQGGWVTANELRARENMPPHANGDQLQETPVGGAPNSAPASAPAGAPSNGKPAQKNGLKNQQLVLTWKDVEEPFE